MSRKKRSIAIAAAVLGAVVVPLFTLRILSRSVTVQGRVIFQGTPPPSGGPFSLPNDPPGLPPRNDESFLASPDGSLANVLVHLKEGAARKSGVHAEKVRVERENCLFRPRVFGVRVGQSIEFENRDRRLHTARRSAGKNPPFILPTLPQGTVTTKPFANEECPLELWCDLHGWERAFAGVFDHPYFAVTGPDGTFSFRRSSGRGSTRSAWHERLGTLEERVLCLGLEETVLFAYESPAR